MKSIDLNCDLGEAFGIYEFGHDALLLEEISSANIACGFHAGDPMVMQRTVQLCLQKGVSLGAHPGFPDLVGFGRREMTMSASEIYTMVLYQIGALDAIAHAEGGGLRHVKPHGALYHVVCRDAWRAAAFAKAVFDFRPELIVYGLPNSCLSQACADKGMLFAAEAFIDRRYLDDGSLAPRSMEEAVISDTADAIKQALCLAQGLPIRTIHEKPLAVNANTLCIHGDGPLAIEIAQAAKRALMREGYRIEPIALPY